VRVCTTGVDPGVRQVYAGLATDGYRCSMSGGEFQSIAHLQDRRSKTAMLVFQAAFPRLPRVCRCLTDVVGSDKGTMLNDLAAFWGVYGHESLAHAKLTVRVCPLAATAPMRSAGGSNSLELTSALPALLGP
jgi:hypothetical protein